MLTEEQRAAVVTMVRARHEERWIAMLLERSFQVSREIVIMDDGDTLDQAEVCQDEMSPFKMFVEKSGVVRMESEDGSRVLHYIFSPFRPAARGGASPNEVRDREFLWQYTKTMTAAKYVLCLDGDEALSRRAVRVFPQIIEAFERDDVEMFSLPFIYLWDGLESRRVDGWYGDDSPAMPSDAMPTARFPRVFSLARMTVAKINQMRFKTTGHLLHCGSIPMEHYEPHGTPPRHGFAKAPVIHFGYIDDDLRQRKFKQYTEMDPNNETEGYYLHIIGKPNQYGKTPQVRPWIDE